ncbi:MAG: hypothetical protein ABEJ89_03230 [Haloarculaceae archaeon]
MATRSGRTDMGIGLGLVFGLVAVGAAVVAALLGFQHSLGGLSEAMARTVQVNTGIAIAVAIAAACLAVAGVHLFGE